MPSHQPQDQRLAKLILLESAATQRIDTNDLHATIASSCSRLTNEQVKASLNLGHFDLDPRILRSAQQYLELSDTDFSSQLKKHAELYRTYAGAVEALTRFCQADDRIAEAALEINLSEKKIRLYLEVKAENTLKEVEKALSDSDAALIILDSPIIKQACFYVYPFGATIVSEDNGLAGIFTRTNVYACKN